MITNSSNDNDTECGAGAGLGSFRSSSCSSLHLARSSCTSVGLPVTPDSVVGTNILLLDGLHCGCSAPITQPHSTTSTSSSSASTLSSEKMSSASLTDNSYDGDDVTSLASQKLLLNNLLSSELDPHYHVAPDYLHSSVLISPTPIESKDQGVSERCRRRTCEWMYDICDHFQLQREVVGIALFYVDRYFTITFEGDRSECECGNTDGKTSPTPSCSSQHRQVPVTRKEFQLVAPTRRRAAARPQHIIAVCASISRNQFTSQDIELCEMKMLNTLNWHVNPIVSSGSIIDLLLAHLPTFPSQQQLQQDCDDSMDHDCLSVYVYDCAKYLAELSVSIPALCLVYAPSILAYSSILYALETILSASTANSMATSFKKMSSSSSSISPSSNSSCLLTDTYLEEYEMRIRHVSSDYFEREKEHVDSAKKILQTICPNLGELIIPSSTMMNAPTSPISVKSLA
ncbi:hypothetical protein ACHAWU_003790 [Discostella pseudostelligera]|uniref:Cyclin N-terminal domain-containing protein n=1 Tax=Discostella pseudostelligera TaxID=259834 RepID=A0ABD3MLL6_9STRA